MKFLFISTRFVICTKPLNGKVREGFELRLSQLCLNRSLIRELHLLDWRSILGNEVSQDEVFRATYMYLNDFIPNDITDEMLADDPLIWLLTPDKYLRDRARRLVKLGHTIKEVEK